MESRRLLATNKIFESKDLILLAVFVWLIWLWQRRHIYKFCWNFPTRWGWPFIGNLAELKSMANIFPVFEKAFEEHKSDNVLIWGGLYPLIITRDPKFIRFALTARDTLDKAESLYHSVHAVFRTGLITNRAKEWKYMRPLLQPCFSHDNVLYVFPMFNQQKTKIVNNLAELTDGKPHNVLNVLQSGILDLTIKTTMGHNEVDKSKMENFVKNFLDTVDVCVSRILLGFLNLSWLLVFKNYKQTKDTQNIIDKFVHQSLTKMDKEVRSDFEISDIFMNRIHDLYKSNQINNKQLTGESTTMFTAAFETTTGAMYTVLVMMAMFPDMQDRLYEELRSIFPDPNCEIHHDDLAKAPYFDLVVKESLRLVPSLPLIGRHLRQDVKYKEWPDAIPKDVQIIICIYHVHRHKKIWGPDAAEFRPERFSDENLTSEQRNAYVPFSKGFRSCIGSSYAQLALKVIVAGILLNFELRTDFKYKDLKFIENITMKYHEKPAITLRRRNKPIENQGS